MQGDPTSAAPPVDALQQVLDDTRKRFVATFAAQCDAMCLLINKVGVLGAGGPVGELMQVTHRLNGLAGTIGFPSISARASELETLVEAAGRGAFDAVRARDAVDAIRLAFRTDLASPPVRAPQAVSRVRGAKILLAEDEADQRAIVTACLQGAGYEPLAVASGDLVIATAREEKPAVILLDIAMPGLDGYTVCKRLKADPDLAGIPVIFMTAGANLDDRLTGLALGADEFLAKPVDMRELVLRIQLLLKRHAPRGTPAARESSVTGPAGRTVVIAEDDPEVTRIVDAQMRAAGYSAILAFDGEQALAAVRAHAADVLVLDLMMPNLNGFDVLGLLRESPPPKPRILVLSGRGCSGRRATASAGTSSRTSRAIPGPCSPGTATTGSSLDASPLRTRASRSRRHPAIAARSSGGTPRWRVPPPSGPRR